MIEHKLTYEEIKKALECCLDAECNKCPLLKDNDCRCNLVSVILDLINRQQAEIAEYQKHIDNDIIYVKRVKSEAIKEFAERLKVLNKTRMILWDEHIDNLVKEMTGEIKPETDFPKDYSFGY